MKVVDVQTPASVDVAFEGRSQRFPTFIKDIEVIDIAHWPHNLA